MNVRFDHREDHTPGIATFWFKPEHPVRYTAGQFTELYLPHERADSRGQRRWFTLSSSPTEPLLGITTKFASRDGSSFKQQLAALRPGTPLQLADPMGDFVLPKDPTIPLLFIAAGLGITPVRSMVKWLLDTGQQRTIHLVHTAAHPDQLAFAPLFTEYPMQYTPLTQRISTNHILELAGKNNPLIYLSGPEAMIETFFKELTATGISPDRLVPDYYPGYQEL